MLLLLWCTIYNTLIMTKEEYLKSKQRVIDLLKSTNIDYIDDFIKDLEHSGYFTAPASMKNHLCFEGGLMFHSLNVYDAAMELKKTFSKIRPDVFDDIDDASIVVASLLHDMCKSNLYFKKRNAQVEFGQAEYGTTYGDLPIGHGEKSVVMLLQMGIPLTDAEVCAIRWHMGAWSVAPADSEQQGNFRAAEKLYPLVTLIQLADTIASKIYERGPKTIN